MKRANRLLVIGIVVTLVGAGLVGMVLWIDRTPVQAETRPEAAEGDSDESDVEESQQDLSPRIPVIEHLDLVDDVEAIALTVDFASSVAGLPEVGDRVNIYGVPEPDEDEDPDADAAADDADAADDAEGDDGQDPLLEGSVERLLTDVVVLAITGAVHEGNSGTPTLVVAVPSDQIAGALSAHRFATVHFALVGGPEEDADDTDDADATDDGADRTDADGEADVPDTDAPQTQDAA